MLNEKVQSDLYALPRIDDLVAKIQGRVFSSIDLKDAYHQIPLEEQAIPWTAFSAPCIGTYEFLRLPFGLKTAPAGFQRFIDHVLWGMSSVVVFIDDIVVFSDTISEHLDILTELFQRLLKFGLRVNVKKSVFFRSMVQFLGFDFDCHGYRPTSSAMPKLERFDATTYSPPVTSVFWYRGVLR